jgi:long-chain acyl-CoA synthetase
LKQTLIKLDRASVFSLVCSLVSAELELSRKNRFDPGELADWDETTPLTGGGIEMDSIELLQVSSAVDEFFHLHDTGIEEYLLRHRALGLWCDLVLQAYPGGQRHLTFRTSGSQGAAKSNTHRAATLMQEISCLARLFRGRERIVCLVAPHHIYGFLLSILLPQALAIPVVAARHWPVGKILRALAPGDLVVGHPLIWQELQRRANALPTDVHGVTSTAPCNPRLIAALRAMGLARMTEVYGSSETGGIGFRHDPARPYRLFAHWQRTQNRGAGAGEFGLKRGREKAVLLPDLLDWRGPRSFRPLHRKDQAVQVAGINVYPQDVARRLREHPAIADCAVRLMRIEVGDRLKAFIVPKNRYNKSALRPELEQWIYARFSSAERPVALAFGKALPVTQNGKSADW